MPGQLPTLDQTLRTLRILHVVFMATMVMYAYVLHIVTPPPAVLDLTVFWSISGLASGSYCASMRVRRGRSHRHLRNFAPTPMIARQ